MNDLMLTEEYYRKPFENRFKLGDRMMFGVLVIVLSILMVGIPYFFKGGEPVAIIEADLVSFSAVDSTAKVLVEIDGKIIKFTVPNYKKTEMLQSPQVVVTKYKLFGMFETYRMGTPENGEMIEVKR